jgi:GMP synthase (glutamine-hydrolysing)
MLSLRMHLLFLLHSGDVPAGIYRSTVHEQGHTFGECSYALGSPPEGRLAEYDAAIVFGGTTNIDDGRPWIRSEVAALQQLLEARVPTLGICLGSQLLALAAGATVRRASRPEIGWYDVEVSLAASTDPLFAGLPPRFVAYGWHAYRLDVPDDGVLLAESRLCPQAYRVRNYAWGLMFHPEVTRETAREWINTYGRSPEVSQLLPPEQAIADIEERIESWNALGRRMCVNFLTAAQALPAVTR